MKSRDRGRLSGTEWRGVMYGSPTRRPREWSVHNERSGSVGYVIEESLKSALDPRGRCLEARVGKKSKMGDSPSSLYHGCSRHHGAEKRSCPSDKRKPHAGGIHLLTPATPFPKTTLRTMKGGQSPSWLPGAIETREGKWHNDIHVKGGTRGQPRYRMIRIYRPVPPPRSV